MIYNIYNKNATMLMYKFFLMIPSTPPPPPYKKEENIRPAHWYTHIQQSLKKCITTY